MSSSRNATLLLSLAGAAILALAQTPAPPTGASGASGRGRGGGARPQVPTRDPHTAGYVTATELPDGTVPSPTQDGNFIIGPTQKPAPESVAHDGVPKGDLSTFSMESTDSKIYPGIARDQFGTPDPNNPAKLDVPTSHPARLTRAAFRSTCRNSMCREQLRPSSSGRTVPIG